MLQLLKIVLLQFIIIYCCIVNANRIRYDNYRVYEVYLQTQNDLKFIEKLEATTNGNITIFEYRRNYQSADKYQGNNRNIKISTIVSPEHNSNFVNALKSQRIPIKLINDNLQSILDLEKAETAPDDNVTNFSQNEYTWTKYHSLEETYDWLESLEIKYPDNVKLLRVGKTYEGRDILGVKISYNNETENKSIFIEGGIHAREWISPATVTYIINQLLTNQDNEVKKTVQKYDWYIVPHFNPDGYVYSQTTDRLWRKTRSRNGWCYGTDLNRNWDIEWGTTGASFRSCSQIFAGTSAFSEIETRTISEFLRTLQGNLRTYLAFHAFGEVLVFPFGYSDEATENYDDLQRIGEKAAEVLSQRYGTEYTVGDLHNTIYPTSGGSMDWAYGVIKVPVTYTYELRPESGDWNGFVLPERYIIPTAEETFDSVIALVNEAENLGYYN